jgi:hypothetical protein
VRDNATKFGLVTAGLLLVFGLVGCGTEEGSAAPAMPDVVGEQLDVASSDIKRAGYEGEVEVVGGGTFGVVTESNWQVCEQLPAPGEPMDETPRLTVDRSCSDAAQEPSEEAAEPEDTQKPSEEAAEPEVTQKPNEDPPAPVETQEVLTAENSEALAALLSGSDCDDTVEAFAAEFAGRTLAFNGNFALMDDLGGVPNDPAARFSTANTEVRYDVLIYGGDFDSASGPSFKFADVGIADLNLVGNVPATVGTGDNVRINATVDSFNRMQCLFFLRPVSVELR